VVFFGGSAPSRSAHTATAPLPTRTATKAPLAPPPAVQQPHTSNAPTPTHQTPNAIAQPQPAAGGGLLSGLASTVMQGMAFGTGSAVAHRAVDAIAGPRTVVHEHNNVATDNNSSNISGFSSIDSSPSRDGATVPPGVCGDEVRQFQQCMKDNDNSFQSCSFYFDVLKQCETYSKDNAKWTSQ